MLLNQADTDSSSVLYETTFGGGGGMGASHFWDVNWGMGLDITYSYQGQRKNYGLDDTTFFDGFVDVQLQYVKIPVTAMYRNDSDTRFRYTAALGPMLMFLLEGRRIYSETEFYTEAAGDVTDEYNMVNWGLYTSHGIGYRLGEKIWLNLNFRADWAISDAENKSALIYNQLTQTADVYPADRPKTHNVILGASLGAQISFGPKGPKVVRK